MSAEYLHDLYIKPLEMWTRKEQRNWLHPCHGRLPDHLGLVLCGKHRYRVALWCLENSIVTVTEVGPKDAKNFDERVLTPNEEEQLARKKGWILSSLTWHRQDDNGLICQDVFLDVPPLDEDGDEDEWRTQVFRNVMIYTVNIIAETPIGGPTRHGRRTNVRLSRL